MKLEWMKEESKDSNDSFPAEMSFDIDDIDIKEELIFDNSRKKMDMKEEREDFIDEMLNVQNPGKMKKMEVDEEIFSNSFEEAPSNLALLLVGTYECAICWRRFSVSNGLKRHIALHTEKPFDCEVSKFTQESNLKIHMVKHMGERPFESDFCNAKFNRNSNDSLLVERSADVDDIDIKEELLFDNSGKKIFIKEEKKDFKHEIFEDSVEIEKTEENRRFEMYECVICWARFSYSNGLKRHIAMHTKKPFECKICKSKLSRSQHNITTHMRTHTGEKPFKCEVCKAKFARKPDLKIHMRIHTGEKPYECEVCKAKFTQLANVTSHMIIHTGEKPFKCEVCKAKFARKPDLKIHMRIHTGEKPFECEVCKAKFTQSSHVTSHMRIHTGEKPFKCEVCKAKFTRGPNLKLHMRKHTGEKPFKCEICKSKFARKPDLKIHMRIHTGEKPFECEVCKRKFTQLSHLTSHMKSHTEEKPFECEVCKVKFGRKPDLKIHMQIHTGEKPFE